MDPFDPPVCAVVGLRDTSYAPLVASAFPKSTFHMDAKGFPGMDVYLHLYQNRVDSCSFIYSHSFLLALESMADDK